jgi:hypothetical protein
VVTHTVAQLTEHLLLPQLMALILFITHSMVALAISKLTQQLAQKLNATSQFIRVAIYMVGLTTLN